MLETGARRIVRVVVPGLVDHAAEQADLPIRGCQFAIEDAEPDELLVARLRREWEASRSSAVDGDPDYRYGEAPGQRHRILVGCCLNWSLAPINSPALPPGL